MKKRERAIQIMESIIQHRQELRELEAELDRLLPSRRREKEAAESKASPPPSSGGNGRGGEPHHPRATKKGELMQTLLRGAKTLTGEFTSRQVIVAAGIPKRQESSAFAAMSRMAAKGKHIVKGSAPGKFRRVP